MLYTGTQWRIKHIILALTELKAFFGGQGLEVLVVHLIDSQLMIQTQEKDWS